MNNFTFSSAQTKHTIGISLSTFQSECQRLFSGNYKKCSSQTDWTV